MYKVNTTQYFFVMKKHFLFNVKYNMYNIMKIGNNGKIRYAKSDKAVCGGYKVLNELTKHL